MPPQVDVVEVVAEALEVLPSFGLRMVTPLLSLRLTGTEEQPRPGLELEGPQDRTALMVQLTTFRRMLEWSST